MFYLKFIKYDFCVPVIPLYLIKEIGDLKRFSHKQIKYYAFNGYFSFFAVNPKTTLP